jgi:LCP family protein required for cell wall assembly
LNKNKKTHNHYEDGYNEVNIQDIFSSSRRQRKKRIIVNSLISLFSLSAMITGGALLYMNHMLDTVNYQPLSEEDEKNQSLPKDAIINTEVFNIIVFGINENNSDTNMLISIDNKHKKLKVTSFLRDIWINIPGHGERKFNAAFAIGREKLAVETLQKNFNIKVDKYVTLNFDAFEGIINAIGGLDIELTVPEIKYINIYSKVTPHLALKPGITHLNGRQALNHARNRDIPTKEFADDYARTQRQREVISVMLGKLKSSNIMTMLDAISRVLPKITTNFSKPDIANLMPHAQTYIKYELSEFKLPTADNLQSGAKKGDQIVEVIRDWKKARLDLQNFIYER